MNCCQRRLNVSANAVGRWPSQCTLNYSKATSNTDIHVAVALYWNLNRNRDCSAWAMLKEDKQIPLKSQSKAIPITNATPSSLFHYHSWHCHGDPSQHCRLQSKCTLCSVVAQLKYVAYTPVCLCVTTMCLTQQCSLAVVHTMYVHKYVLVQDLATSH